MTSWNAYSTQAAAAPKPTMNQLMTGNQVEKDKIWNVSSEVFAIVYIQASSGLGSAWPDGSQQQQQQGNQEINPFF